MKNFRLTTFLTSNVTGIDNESLNLLFDKCSLKKYKGGEYLIQPDENCQHSFFVEKGLLRQYAIDKKGKEHTIQFAPEGWLMTDRESVFFSEPSKYYIQAIEDSTVLMIEPKVFEALAKENKSFQRFNNRLLQNHIRQLQYRINLLLSATAEERYLDFIKTYPDILLRVPQTMVATYLGIAPESLSRVRKNLANKSS
ncbi:Crp/Fnr family transcriptional regulator [Mesonia sp. K7]|uniref:Crp/Fnr family transcriptional regulator n=1 Tax=Mesonia sp. K7 TaxID=2218606 RepID=UPI000DA7C99A|nr:Crp/Fnr family transcriptional regulator [Mesonia sp. K7]PZD77849.1 Crp/Fnr family transcriptional regulator [Mesonia sp. K7]